MSTDASKSSVLLLRSGVAAFDAALAAELQRRAPSGLHQADTWPSSLPDDVGLVCSAAEGSDYELPKAALAAGAHFVDLDDRRGRILDGAEALADVAGSGGLQAVFGAGLLPGLIEPFVRETADGLRRVNEVLIGIAPGSERFGVFAPERLLASMGTRISMLLGAEQTEREALGDERWIEHPAPVGPLQSVNVDAADLELYTKRPIKATSVRVSFSQATKAERRLLQRAAKFVPRGWFGGAAGAAARLGKLAGKGSGGALVTLMVRGIDAKQLPRERRVSILHPGGAGALAAIPAGLVVERCLAGRAPSPEGYAGPAEGWIQEAELLEALSQGGASVVEGDLGGWRGAHTAS